jgi:hypothetical protein
MTFQRSFNLYSIAYFQQHNLGLTKTKINIRDLPLSGKLQRLFDAVERRGDIGRKRRLDRTFMTGR